MTQVVSVTSQGQISIPASMRRLLDIDNISQVLVSLDSRVGRLVVEPIIDLRSLRGTLKGKKSVSSRKVRTEFEKYLAERSA